jgi:hypothetical protein
MVKMPRHVACSEHLLTKTSNSGCSETVRGQGHVLMNTHQYPCLEVLFIRNTFLWKLIEKHSSRNIACSENAQMSNTSLSKQTDAPKT